MKNVFFITGSLFVLTAANAKASSIYCMSKYFNNSPAQAVLRADVTSSTEISNVTLVIDNEPIFSAASLTKDDSYRPTKSYADYISLKGKKNYSDNNWSISKILFPANFSENKKFVAIVAEQASDGGSYNKLFCYNNP